MTDDDYAVRDALEIAELALARAEDAERERDNYEYAKAHALRLEQMVEAHGDAISRLIMEREGALARCATLEQELAIERERNHNRVICPKCQANLPCESCARYSVLRDRLERALRQIAEMQPRVLGYIRDNGFVFTDMGREPGNWQHLAFSIYTDLCEMDMIARGALTEDAVGE